MDPTAKLETITIQSRREFYYDRQFAVILLCFMLFFLAILLFILVLSQYRRVPVPQYFMVNTNQQLTISKPINTAWLTSNQLLNWASQVVQNSLSFNFDNLETRFTTLQAQFTVDAFKSYLANLEQVGQLSFIKQQRLITQATLRKAPTITQEGLVDNRYLWNMTVPVLYKIYGGRQYTRAYLIEVRLQIGRVETTEFAAGVKIFNYQLANISELQQRF